MKNFIRVINAVCFLLFVVVFPINDMIQWKTRNYLFCLRFELNCWWHNVSGKMNQYPFNWIPA
jgi:hypothetical protein